MKEQLFCVICDDGPLENLQGSPASNGRDESLTSPGYCEDCYLKLEGDSVLPVEFRSRQIAMLAAQVQRLIAAQKQQALELGKLSVRLNRLCARFNE
jgi:hypothetical protein